jgi:hypothetical protein
MSRRLLVGLIIVVVLACAGYWFSAQRSDGPAIATLPPAQAVGFFATPGLPQAWTEVRQSKFYQHLSSPAFWQQALGPEGYERVTATKEAIEHHLGLSLSEPTFDLLLGRECGLALVPSQRNVVDVIVYARVSGAERIAETVSRSWSRTPRDAVRQTQVVDGFEVVTLHLKDALTSVSYAFLGTVAVLATDQAWVVDAIKAHRGAASERLQAAPAFKALRLETEGALMAYGYYDAERLQADMLAELSKTSQGPPAAALQLLQRTGKVTLSARRASAGLMVDLMAWDPPQGRSSVLRQADRDGAVPPFPGVPAETFYLTHVDLIDLQGLWQLLTQLAAAADQDGWQRTLARFRAWAGVDLERDVLPLFTGVVGLGLTAPFGTPYGSPTAQPGLFLTLGLADEAKGLRLMQAVGARAGGPLLAAFLQRRVHDGHTLYYLSNPMLFPNPGYVISRGQLILASDVSLLQHMLDAASGKTTPLTATKAYRDVRQHFRTAGGSVTFVDVQTAVQEVRHMWVPLNAWLQAVTRSDRDAPAAGSMLADPWALAELLRPIPFLGVASQAEPQGVRTEVFVALQDVP